MSWAILEAGRAVEIDLAGAIAAGELEVWYQPQVAAHSLRARAS